MFPVTFSALLLQTNTANTKSNSTNEKYRSIFPISIAPQRDIGVNYSGAR